MNGSPSLPTFLLASADGTLPSRLSRLDYRGEDSLWLARAKLIDYSLIAGLLYYQLDACDGPSQAWCLELEGCAFQTTCSRAHDCRGGASSSPIQ